MKRFIIILLTIVALPGWYATASYAQKPTEKTVTYEVSMHCKSCAAKIERDIAFEKGVKEVTASLDTKLVTIRYVEGKTTEEKLAQAIKKLGYEVKTVMPEPKNEGK